MAEVRKTCPIAPTREDGTPGMCREERCAWWTGTECAVVRMTKLLEKPTAK